MDCFRLRQDFGGQVVAALLAMTTRRLVSAFYPVSRAAGYTITVLLQLGDPSVDHFVEQIERQRSIAQHRIVES